jgi:hypothetical protein
LLNTWIGTQKIWTTQDIGRFIWPGRYYYNNKAGNELNELMTNKYVAISVMCLGVNFSIIIYIPIKLLLVEINANSDDFWNLIINTLNDKYIILLYNT